MSRKLKYVLYTCASERDNPYDKRTQPKEHAVWHDAYWAVWLESRRDRKGDGVLKEEAATAQEQCQFALVWRPFRPPFRLRVNDIVRIDGRLGRVIRVSDCAAVVMVNQPVREFSTRFDKPVRFQPPPRIFRISANAEAEIVTARRKTNRKEAR